MQGFRLRNCSKLKAELMFFFGYTFVRRFKELYISPKEIDMD